jgi:hypothetical protein
MKETKKVRYQERESEREKKDIKKDSEVSSKR